MNYPLKPAETAEQVDAIARTAHDAFLAASAVAPEDRAAWLRAVAAALEAHADELVGIAMEETHLAEPRLRGELRRSAFQLALFAQELVDGVPLDATIDHADPDWGMGPRPDIRRVNVPLGVVGVFGASNFPFAFSVMGGDTASALTAGCAVLHKIHDAHSRLALRTAEVVVEALAAAGAPEGLFAVVAGREGAEALVDHPLVKAIGFTGSTAVGRLLLDRAAARPEPIPFYGELGSINPVFVLPQAWAERSDDILAGFAGSFTMGMGQFCTKPGVLFAPAGEAVGERLQRALADVTLAQLLSPGLRDSFGRARDEVGAVPGVATLVAGSDDEIPAPTVFEVEAKRVLEEPEIVREEMFGPATVVVRYAEGDSLPELAGVFEGQLTATVHASATDEHADLVDVLTQKAGRVLWNGWPTGVTVSYAQHHGGPYPATTASGTTSVGTAAVRRFVRPVSYQDFPDDALPPALQEANPWRILRRVDGRFDVTGPAGREQASR